MAHDVTPSPAPHPISELDLPHGPRGSALAGEKQAYVADPIGFVWERYRRYGPIFITHLGQPTVFLIGPEAQHFMLGTHRACFSWAHAWPKSTRALTQLWGSDTLNMCDGADYLQWRDLLAPAFSPDMLGLLFEHAWIESARHTADWSRAGELMLFPKASHLFTSWLLDWLVDDPLIEFTLRARLRDVLEVFTDLAGVPSAERQTALQGQALSREKQAVNTELQHLLHRVIARRRAHPSGDAVSQWIQARGANGENLSNAQIARHVLLFMMSGNDSCAAMLTWCVAALAQYPAVRDGLRAEIDTTLKDRPLTPAQAKKMPYLAGVLKEVERFYPLQMGGARAVAQSCEFMGYTLPRGWQARTCSHVSHHLPEVFDAPERFDPERFMDPRAEDKRTPYSLIGFGAGPRQCTGKMVALALLQPLIVRLVRDYDGVLAENQDLTPRLMSHGAVFAPRSQLRVRFVRREAG